MFKGYEYISAPGAMDGKNKTKIGTPDALFHGLDRNKYVKTILKKRFSRINYPFIFWIILIIVTVHIYGGNEKYFWNI